MVKQIKIGGFVGSVKLLAQHVTPYLSVFTMVFAGIAAYVPIADWFRGYGIDFPFWLFALLVAIGVAALFILEYMIIFPSFFSAWNKQWWDHDNPAKAELEDIKAQLKRIEGKLK